MKNRSENGGVPHTHRRVKLAAITFASLLAIGGLGFVMLVAPPKSDTDFAVEESRPVEEVQRADGPSPASSPTSAPPVLNNLDTPEREVRPEPFSEPSTLYESREMPGAAQRPPRVLWQLSEAPPKGARVASAASGTLDLSEAIRRDKKIRAQGDAPIINEPAPRMLVPQAGRGRKGASIRPRTWGSSSDFRVRVCAQWRVRRSCGGRGL